MKIREIIRESVEDLNSKFKIFYKDLDDRWQDLVKDRFQILENSLKNGIIYNMDFNDSKDILNRAYERALKVLDEKLHKAEAGLERDQSIDFKLYAEFDYSGSYPSIHSSNSLLKKLEKGLSDSKVKELDKHGQIKILQEEVELHKCAIEIKKIFEQLKTKIVKGRKPNTNIDPNKFYNKLGSKESQELVTKELKAGIGPRLDEYEAKMKDYFQNLIDGILDMTTYKSDRNDPDQETLMILQRCFDFDSKREEGGVLYSNIKLNEKGKTYAKDEAKKERDALEKNFLSKNIKKLSNLVDVKGNLETIKELPKVPVVVKAGVGRVEAGFDFTFADKSSFTVINKIVYKYSYRGKPFVQFPTTFHNIVFPDGTKMKMPSEEKMIKEFGSWKPE